MEIVSTQMIKPSSPTPHHLRKHKLSFLDQQAPPTYVPLVFFYKSPPLSFSENLKQSLSHVLTNFYPLAGRIIDDELPYVDCNDEGVEYVETRVHAHMSDVTEDPDPRKFQKYGKELLPIIITPLSIQVNRFDCGGLAVAACIAHKIGDMESLLMFINAWSTACRLLQQVIINGNGNSVVVPDFEILWSHFPSRPLLTAPPPNGESGTSRGKVVSKRFLFDGEMLSKLKRMGVSPEVENPSRIEVVTAFLWESFVVSHKQRNNTEFIATHSVNLRSQLMASRGFGNGYTIALAKWRSRGKDRLEERGMIPLLTGELRGAITRAKMNKQVTADCDTDKTMVEEYCIFTSWCRLPMYEVDYGWGKPQLVSPFGAPDFTNVVAFMDTKKGDGVETFVIMGETDMEMIQENYKQLQLKIEH